ncbi:MAG TPA: PilZ domain-containing protein [Candidatus Elarobacter sp.]|nr:PilZ domain-containing protein [Candidatus Elarobacter sp.]
MSEPSERRQARRVEIRVPVVYRGPDGSPKTGMTANVSPRGMLIVARGSAQPGTPLRVAITGADGREREIAGEIVRTTSDGHLAVSLTEDAGVLQSLIDADANQPAIE